MLKFYEFSYYDHKGGIAFFCVAEETFDSKNLKLNKKSV